MPQAFRRVLIVEDDVNTADAYLRMLQLEGYEVFLALDADTGLRVAEKEAPDAILLDLRMPLMDGLGFLRLLRARTGMTRTPVALVTGDYLIDDSTIQELRALGAEVRFKPLWVEDITSLVAELLAQSPKSTDG